MALQKRAIMPIMSLQKRASLTKYVNPLYNVITKYANNVITKKSILILIFLKSFGSRTGVVISNCSSAALLRYLMHWCFSGWG